MQGPHNNIVRKKLAILIQIREAVIYVLAEFVR